MSQKGFRSEIDWDTPYNHEQYLLTVGEWGEAGGGGGGGVGKEVKKSEKEHEKTQLTNRSMLT